MALADTEKRALEACLVALREAVRNLEQASAHASLLQVTIVPARGITTPTPAYEAVYTSKKLVEHQLEQLTRLSIKRGEN